MANANFKLARRHAHFTSQAGYWDGSVRLAHEIEAAQAAPSGPVDPQNHWRFPHRSATMPPMRHEKTLVIRPEFLNHAGNLFGGYMMKWADEMAYSAASLAFPDANFVTKLFGQFDFKSPVLQGDIIKVFSEVVGTGHTSCTINVWAINARLHHEVFRTFAVMVNVQNGQKIPLAPRTDVA